VAQSAVELTPAGLTQSPMKEIRTRVLSSSHYVLHSGYERFQRIEVNHTSSACDVSRQALLGSSSESFSILQHQQKAWE